MFAALLLTLSLGLAAPALGGDARIDTTKSAVTLYLYRTGLFAFAGDNHQIRAPLHSGSLNEPLTRVELEFQSRDLRVEDPGKPANRTAQVQERMVGPEVLDVARYPTITFRSTSIERAQGARFTVNGELTLRGVTRPIVVPVERISAHEYRGSVSLRMSEFGIRQISVAGGTVKVKDGFKVDFDVVTR